MPPEIAQKLQTGGDLYSEIIASAKKMKLKVVAGKLPARKLIDTGVPIIAKRKDGNFLLLLGKNKGSWFVADPAAGKPFNIEEEKLYELLSGNFIIIGKNRFSPGNDANKKIRFQMVYSIDSEIQKTVYLRADCRFCHTDSGHSYAADDAGCRR